MAASKVASSFLKNIFLFCVKVYLLLKSWKNIVPDQAIELLHFQYADVAVRHWAVKCLETLR